MFTASRRARAFARVSAMRIRCGMMKRVHVFGTGVADRFEAALCRLDDALAIAVRPFSSDGTWRSFVSTRREAFFVGLREQALDR